MPFQKKILNIYFATHKTCNLNCSYCYIPQYNKNQRKEDDNKIICRLNEFIFKVENENYTIGSFCLHGAEPSLMAPETLAEIVRIVNMHRKKNNIYNNAVAIQSNGIRFTSEYLDVLQSLLNNPKELRIGFSIDPPKVLHDKYRNNSFDLVEKNYKEVMKRGFPVSILSVVTKDVLMCLYDFKEWMSKQLILKKNVDNPYKVKIKLATGELALNEEELKEFAFFLYENNLSGLLQILSPGYCIQSGNECLWFEFALDGGCYSCNKAFFDERIFANWQNETIDEIFKKRIDLYKETFMHSDCSECQYEIVCNSGCPIDRYKSGKMAGKAHECSLIKIIYGELEKKNKNIIEFFNNN